jgi:hypothetical protein
MAAPRSPEPGSHGSVACPANQSALARPPRREAEPGGYHWRDPEQVRCAVPLMKQRAAERAEDFAVLLKLMPLASDLPCRVMDRGVGYGAVIAAILDRFPLVEAVCLDSSEGMIAAGQEYLASNQIMYDGNFEIATYCSCGAATGDIGGQLRAYYRSGVATKFGGYSNPQVDALIDQLDTEFDTQKQYDLAKRIQTLVFDDVARSMIRR